MYYFLFTFLATTAYAYNYYMLAMQDWCEPGYQIHGLWPQYNATSWPENCGLPAYEEITNETLLVQMNSEWANCGQPQSSLWSHEWNKHMTCIMQQYPGKYTQNSLFQLVLDLFINTPVSKYCNFGATDCYACYDLDFKLIDCPQ